MNPLAVLEFTDYVLQLILLVLLLRGFFREYLILGIYCVVQLLITTVEEFVFHYAGAKSHVYSHLYWADEVIIDALLFLMVIVLTERALKGKASLPRASQLLRIVAAAAMILPFVVFYQRDLFGPFWFNGTSQLLSFGAAIMNLFLWTALAGNRKRDPRLLTVSAGLGLAVTAAALYYGIRVFTRGTPEQLLNGFKAGAHALSVLLWCTAFWPRSKGRRVPSAATTSQS